MTHITATTAFPAEALAHKTIRIRGRLLRYGIEREAFSPASPVGGGSHSEYDDFWRVGKIMMPPAQPHPDQMPMSAELRRHDFGLDAASVQERGDRRVGGDRLASA